MKIKYDVVQITFGNIPTWKEGEFKNKIIATCNSYQLAKALISRNNTSFHRFEIVERDSNFRR